MMKKTFKLFALVSICFSIILITSCGGDDGGSEPSDQEILIGLLNGNSFSATSASSTTSAGITVSEVTATFSGGASMNFTLTGGNINTYAVEGGSFDISESGALSNLEITAAEDVEVTPESAAYSASANTVTVEFSTTQSTARVGGIGEFTLVFNVGSN